MEFLRHFSLGYSDISGELPGRQSDRDCDVPLHHALGGVADAQASNRLHARQGLLSHPQRRWKHCWLRRIRRRPAQNAAAVDRDQRGQTETSEKKPRSSRGFFILRFGLGLESTLEFHQLRRRWRLAEHLSRAFLRLTSNQPRCCQLRRSLLPRCSEPRPSHQLEHQFVQMKRY
jgi:hypothetical protein